MTLIELLVAMALLSLVTVMMLGALWQSQRSEAYSRGRSEALDEMRLTMDRMSRDVRQAQSLNATPTASSLDVNTYVDGVATRIRYEATGDQLVRTVNSANAVVLQDGLTTTAIFSYSPDTTNPNMATVVLSVKPANLPETVLTINSEIEFRNV